jgi:hypothetical protein
MLSSYHWWITHAARYPSLAVQSAQVREMGSFAKFMQSQFGTRMINEQPGKELLDWISDDDKNAVDLVARYERLDQDWIRICERLGFEHIPLGRENRVARADYQSFYDEASKRSVAERFSKTMELFGYEF